MQKTEEQALADVQEVFRKIKAVDTTNELITQEIILIDELLTGRKKWFGTPLYRVIYNKLKQLFQLLLEGGFQNLCEPYAKLAYHKKYVQKGADYELVEEAYIEEFSFAPSVIDAYDAMDAAQCCKDPAVIWWHFEHAQWCWRTPESYFSQTITCKNSKKNKNLFLASCERSAWREIALCKRSC